MFKATTPDITKVKGKEDSKTLRYKLAALAGSVTAGAAAAVIASGGGNANNENPSHERTLPNGAKIHLYNSAEVNAITNSEVVIAKPGDGVDAIIDRVDPDVTSGSEANSLEKQALTDEVVAQTPYSNGEVQEGKDYIVKVIPGRQDGPPPAPTSPTQP
ncbi:hypothetical protein COY17_04080 [Candidatus Saccharibacteria bacterium CG_4_10_14_0_2_um_filter_52_9]|nr:MAG: hypothetical protein COY17_04080 [Candidatus Saccharibacteria bacterium CG_4_10_14_0_2_um_filter_52_9]